MSGLTESLGVDLKGGRGGGGVTQTILSHTLDKSIVLASADLVDSQHGAVWDRDH